MRKPPLSEEQRLATWWAQVSQEEEPDLTPWAKLTDELPEPSLLPSACDNSGVVT